jgi:NTE family protein
MNRVICTLILSFICVFSIAQQTEQRPKIGLALSGGAAKGFAHIGVIKYLEELGIEVDYITGTSMGSIIGGLHALGYNSDRMYNIAASQDWELLLSGNIQLKNVAPLEKPFHQKFPFYLAYEDGGVTLPRGVINSQKLDLLIAGIFSPAYQVNDFDSLPIPFRCVAVNLENGQINAFSKGNLGKSIRASMAIPGVFTPEEIDGKLYVDGGVIRNFPVQEVIDMGADLVIGVHVGADLKSKDELKSMFDVISQSSFMMGSLDSREQAKLVNIYIAPDVTGVNSFGFEDYERIVALGYEAAKQNNEQLIKLAEKLSNFKKKEKNPVLPIPNYLSLSKVDMIDTDKPFEDLGKFKFGNFKFGTLSLARIDQGIARIVGTKLYDKVSYTLEDKGKRLGVKLNAKSRESILFTGSLNAFESTNTSVILHGAFYNILSKPSSLKLTARVSEFIGIQGYFQNRIGPNRNWLINLNGKLDKFETPLYDDGQRLIDYNEFDSDISLFFGYEPNNSAYVEIGGGLKRRKLVQPNSAFEDLVRYTNTAQFVGLNASYNSLNRVQFPKQGIQASAQAHFIFGQNVESQRVNLMPEIILAIPETKNYVRVGLKAQGVWTLFDALTSETRIAATYKSNESLLDNIRLGGLNQVRTDGVSFIGIEEGQFQFDTFASIRQDIRVNVFGPLYISGIVNYIIGTRAFLPQSGNSEKDINLIGYGGGIYLRTPLGPLSLELGKTTENSNINSVIGFGFRYIY